MENQKTGFIAKAVSPVSYASAAEHIGSFPEIAAQTK
jgi:hypothetical protein